MFSGSQKDPPTERASGRAVNPGRRGLFRVIGGLVAALASSGLVMRGAAPEDQGEPRYRSASRLVVVDVVVTDAAGRPVRDLKESDFAILENGAPQKIAAFEAPQPRSSDPPSSGSGPRSQDVHSPSAARNILVLDELNNAINAEAYGRQMLEKYLRKHGPDLNQPTALIVVGQDRMEFVHDYTRSAAALAAALKGHHAELPFSQMRGGAYRASERLAKTLWVLEQIASANLHFAGRKNVVWIGMGFPGLTWRNLDPEDRHKFAAAVSQTANLLFDARLAVYTLDPRGLEVAATVYDGTFGDPTTGELLFESLAPETGGKVWRLRNSLDEEIAAGVDEGANYYTLSYHPTNHVWDGQFRKIKVALAKQGLQVSVRSGYYAVMEPALSASQVDDALSGALMSPMPYRGIMVHASVTPANPGYGKYLLRVDPGALYWQPLDRGKGRCQLTAVTATMGKGSQFSTHNVRELEAVVDAPSNRRQGDKTLAFSFVAELPKDTHYIKIVVRDSTNGNLGTAEIRDEVGKPQ